MSVARICIYLTYYLENIVTRLVTRHERTVGKMKESAEPSSFDGDDTLEE